jgi:hypothetical protein
LKEGLGTCAAKERQSSVAKKSTKKSQKWLRFAASSVLIELNLTHLFHPSISKAPTEGTGRGNRNKETEDSAL